MGPLLRSNAAGTAQRRKENDPMARRLTKIATSKGTTILAAPQAGLPAATPSLAVEPDHPQWAEVKRRFAELVEFLICVLTATGFARIAEDAALEALTRLWLAMQRRPDQRIDDLVAFVVRIAFNNAKTLSKAQSWRPQPSLPSGIDVPVFPHEDLQLLMIDSRRAINELPLVLRQVYLPYFKKGLTIEEVAESLNIPFGTANDRLQRARAIIGAKLRSGGHFIPEKKKRAQRSVVVAS